MSDPRRPYSDRLSSVIESMAQTLFMTTSGFFVCVWLSDCCRSVISSTVAASFLSAKPHAAEISLSWFRNEDKSVRYAKPFAEHARYCVALSDLHWEKTLICSWSVLHWHNGFFLHWKESLLFDIIKLPSNSRWCWRGIQKRRKESVSYSITYWNLVIQEYFVSPWETE